jgi:hypothetical protein
VTNVTVSAEAIRHDGSRHDLFVTRGLAFAFIPGD